ncbi:hypothetical protein ACP275_13G047500 [Erythranthe tilingii]
MPSQRSIVQKERRRWRKPVMGPVWQFRPLGVRNRRWVEARITEEVWLISLTMVKIRPRVWAGLEAFRRWTRRMVGRGVVVGRRLLALLGRGLPISYVPHRSLLRRGRELGHSRMMLRLWIRRRRRVGRLRSPLRPPGGLGSLFRLGF